VVWRGSKKEKPWPFGPGFSLVSRRETPLNGCGGPQPTLVEIPAHLHYIKVLSLKGAYIHSKGIPK
jgi:hypothetical protein